jgi:membrane protease subunit HflC
MKKNAITIAIALVLLGIFALLLFSFQVRQSEVVVLTTFGKPAAKNIDQPNIYFKWPWPIQKVNRFDERVQVLDGKYAESYTADQNIVMTSVYVGWRISDASKFFQAWRGGSMTDAQAQLENMLRSATLAVVGNHSLSDFVNPDPAKLRLAQIEDQIKSTLQAELAAQNYGMTIDFLGIKKLGLPEAVTQTVFDRMKSERQKYISEAQYKGEAEATKIKSTAERQAADLIAGAQAVATRIEGEGVAEAAKTLATFQENPELAVFQLQLDALKNSLNQKSTLIFDERTPPFSLFRSLPTNSPAK